MTKEEATKWLKTFKGRTGMAELSQAFDVAIQALEQEPCTDVISRQAAIDCLNADFTIDGKENMETVVDYINGAFKQIKALPSVTPQPKMGHWIRVDSKKVRCSECDVIHLIAQYPLAKIDWCPNCGAKMVEPQESEVNNG